MSNILEGLLKAVSDWNGKFTGAFNIRENGECAGRQSTKNIRIESKTDKPGLDIRIRPGTKGETVSIPACVTHGGVDDLVYNDFYIGAGEKLCTKDENDNPILAIGSTNSISVSQKILSTLQSNNWVSFAQDLTSQGVAASDIWDVTLSIFGEGRAPFRVTAFSAIKKLRAYDIDYGIVPMPMVEESQDSYYTNCAALYAYGVVVPNFLSEDDAKFAAYMIDVLSAGGKQYIATAYYDQILKNKDALDVEILDMIFENIVYDVGIVYGFEGLGNIHTTLMTNKSTDIVSQLDTIRDAVNAKIEEVIEKYSK